MAGDKLQGKNASLEERFGGDNIQRMKSEGQDYSTDQGMSRRELLAEMRRRDKGVNTDTIKDRFQGYIDGGMRFNDQAQDYLNHLGLTVPERKKPTPPPTPTPQSPTSQGGGDQKTGNVTGGDRGIVSPISQDNDIGIDGDNNKVNQDNSINQTIDSRDQSDNRRYYGGSSRTFNYKGGDGESNLYDTPVSAATMGGFYDTDDSPAAAAKFMDMYIDSNNLNQKDIRKAYDKRKITDYGANDPNRMTDLEGRLAKSIEQSRTRSDKQERKLFGDNPYTGDFFLPQPSTPVVDNTKEIFEESIDRIKKI